MRFIILVFLLIFFSSLQAQTNRYLKVSGGKVFFGTGDVPGYAIYTEYSARLGKGKQSYWKHFQFGGELGFETGATQPESFAPPPSYVFKTFYHISNVSVFAKLAYYPISKTFLKGLNVALGPTVGYSLISKEMAGNLSIQPDGSFIHTTYLGYDNKVFAGYRISIGYEYYFKKILIGARTDWSNNLNGDMNIMYGAKIGWKL